MGVGVLLFKTMIPPTFSASGMGFMEDIFPRTGGVGDGFRMTQTHYIYCDATDLSWQEAELRQKCE